jgi:hypothetical protein
MKKLIKIVIILVLVLIVVALLAVHFFMDTAITKGFNAVGPTITKTDTHIDGASLSIFSGSGKMKGLFIGNPQGYTGAAMQVGSSSFAVQPSSILSDKIIVKSVKIEGPELSLESDLSSVNLKKLLNNIQGGASKETPKEAQPKETSSKANKKLQVDEFVITGTKLHVSLKAPIVGQKSATVPVPDIKLPPMGQGPDGVTVAEVSSMALQKLLEAAIAEGEKVVSDMVKGGQFLGKDLGTNNTSTIQNATKGIGDLLKKK